MGTYIIPRSGTCSIFPRTRINRRTERNSTTRDQIRKNLEFSLSLPLSVSSDIYARYAVLETRYRRTDIARINTDKFHNAYMEFSATIPRPSKYLSTVNIGFRPF